MKKRIPLGLQSYDKLKTGNYYVVDKSLMIRRLFVAGNEVTLITRPRRFGKTLNMSMMASFFDITKGIFPSCSRIPLTMKSFVTFRR